MPALRRDAENATSTAVGRFRRDGGWQERPVDVRPELEGDTRADVRVIGAGFSGAGPVSSDQC
jgi:hypothetical protein